MATRKITSARQSSSPTQQKPATDPLHALNTAKNLPTQAPAFALENLLSPVGSSAERSGGPRPAFTLRVDTNAYEAFERGTILDIDPLKKPQRAGQFVVIGDKLGNLQLREVSEVREDGSFNVKGETPRDEYRLYFEGKEQFTMVGFVDMPVTLKDLDSPYFTETKKRLLAMEEAALLTRFEASCPRSRTNEMGFVVRSRAPRQFFIKTAIANLELDDYEERLAYCMKVMEIDVNKDDCEHLGYLLFELVEAAQKEVAKPE